MHVVPGRYSAKEMALNPDVTVPKEWDGLTEVYIKTYCHLTVYILAHIKQNLLHSLQTNLSPSILTSYVTKCHGHDCWCHTGVEVM